MRCKVVWGEGRKEGGTYIREENGILAGRFLASSRGRDVDVVVCCYREEEEEGDDELGERRNRKKKATAHLCGWWLFLSLFSWVRKVVLDALMDSPFLSLFLLLSSSFSRFPSSLE